MEMSAADADRMRNLAAELTAPSVTGLGLSYVVNAVTGSVTSKILLADVALALSLDRQGTVDG